MILSSSWTAPGQQLAGRKARVPDVTQNVQLGEQSQSMLTMDDWAGLRAMGRLY